jgi:ferritin-like metal-binding protein YciE
MFFAAVKCATIIVPNHILFIIKINEYHQKLYDIHHRKRLCNGIYSATVKSIYMKQELTTITTLHNLLDHEASKFSSAEMQLNNVLPQWISKASSVKLKTVLQKYRDDIVEHLYNLEEFVNAERLISLSLINRIMSAYIQDTNEKLVLCADAEVTDACLLASVQMINHFKISAYGTSAAFANALGMEAAAIFFHKAEVHEKQIDDRLTQLAEYEINSRAKSPIVLPG